MKRVAEINQELKQLKEKKFKLKQERLKQASNAADELRQQYPVVYGWYDEEDADLFFPDLIFASRKTADEHVQKSTHKKTCVYAMASEEMSDKTMLNLMQ